MAGSPLFQRRCRVTFAPPVNGSLARADLAQAIRVEGLRATFKAVHTSGSEPNELTLSVYNLSERTRKAIGDKGTRVILEAGYVQTFAQIFTGDIRVADHVRDGPNIVTKIQAGDADRAINFARIGESFRAGTPLPAIVQKLASVMGVDPGNAVDQAGQLGREFVSGWTSHGRAVEEMDRLLSGTGYGWSVQDNRMQLLAEGETTRAQAVLLSEKTGLIGSPEHGSGKDKSKAGFLKVKSLLMPILRPGVRIRLEAMNQTGDLRAVNVAHTGDTEGQDWYSEVEAVPAR
jgi:hypothetical protein